MGAVMLRKIYLILSMLLFAKFLELIMLYDIAYRVN